MKKAIYSFLCALLIAMPLVPAQAAPAEYLSISDLREQVKDGWHQTYEAYGRSIQVDMDIQIPDVEKAPVLLVKRMPAIAEPLYSQLAERYKNIKNDPKSWYIFQSNEDEAFTAYANNYPFVVDEKGGEDMLSITWPNRALTEYDWSQAYADNNSLTVQEAFDIAVERLHDVFDDNIAVTVQAVGLEDRFYNKKNGKPIRDKGGYLFMARQVLHGIPHAACIKSAFDITLDGEIDGERYYNDFMNRLKVVDADSYSLYCSFFNEKAVLYDDIPLISFDYAKETIEDLINKGNVRNVYSVQLGYVLYDNPDDLNKSYILVPSWVVWCEYYKDAKSEMDEFNKKEMYFNATYYRPVIINAQTGVLVDPKNDEPDRGRSPSIIQW